MPCSFLIQSCLYKITLIHNIWAMRAFFPQSKQSTQITSQTMELAIKETLWSSLKVRFVFLLYTYPTEKAMASHSSTLAWKIPRVEEPGGLPSMGSWRVRHDWATLLSCIGEGNGNPLQCSCLENPRDGGAWWAAIYGVAQSRTRLKWLSSSSSSL